MEPNTGKQMSSNRKVLILPGNGSPIMSLRINRNSRCKYGSGKKSKNCCGTDTRYFHSKTKPEQVTAKLKV